MERWQGALVVAVILLHATLSFLPRAGYGMPLHVDEWQHTAKIVQTLKGGRLNWTDPHYAYEKVKVTHEEGYNILATQVISASRLPPARAYGLLPIFFTIFASLAVFTAVRGLTGNHYAALFSMIFLASLKSDVTVFGLAFALPMTLAIPLIYSGASSLVRGLGGGDARYLACGLTILPGLFFIHPVSALLVAVVAGGQAVMQRTEARKVVMKSKSIILPAALILLALSLALVLSQTSNASGLVETFLERITFPGEEMFSTKTYSLLAYYGAIPMLLAAVGVLAAIRKKLLRHLLVWLAFAAAVAAMYPTLGYTIILPYHRALYMTLLALAPLSGLGLAELLRSTKLNRELTVALAVLLLAVPLLGVYENQLYRAASLGELEVMEYVDLHYPDGLVVAAPLWQSAAVYPMTGDHVLGTMGAQMGGGIWRIDRFYAPGCTDKEWLIGKYNVSLVLSEEAIYCDDFKLVKRGELMLYDVT